MPFSSAAGLPRVALEFERRRIDPDRLDLDQVGPERPVHFALERHRLPGVGVGAGRRARRLGVGDILRDDPQPHRLGLKSGRGDVERGLQRIRHDRSLER